MADDRRSPCAKQVWCIYEDEHEGKCMAPFRPPVPRPEPVPACPACNATVIHEEPCPRGIGGSTVVHTHETSTIYPEVRLGDRRFLRGVFQGVYSHVWSEQLAGGSYVWAGADDWLNRIYNLEVALTLVQQEARLKALTEVHECYEFDATTEEQFDTWLHGKIKEVRDLLKPPPTP